jgi:hypothetical protein
MPTVETPADIERIFDKARSTASHPTPTPNAPEGQRFVVVVTPGRLLGLQACPPPNSMPTAQVAPLQRMLPPNPRRNIAVIAYTPVEALANRSVHRCIPFLGMLMGFAYIGHAVWTFEGHPSALEAGCRHADILFVDGGMLPFLPPDFARRARAVMRNSDIAIVDRQTLAPRPYPIT